MPTQTGGGLAAWVNDDGHASWRSDHTTDCSLIQRYGVVQGVWPFGRTTRDSVQAGFTYGLQSCYCRLVCVLRVRAGRRDLRKVCGGRTFCWRLYVNSRCGLLFFCAHGEKSWRTQQVYRSKVSPFRQPFDLPGYVLKRGTPWIWYVEHVGLACSKFHVNIIARIAVLS